jgi:hypothetical protein
MESGEYELIIKKPLGLIVGLVLVCLLIQFIPVKRTNPPVTSDIPTAPEMKAILKHACYNCHSNETMYPWYSRIAPVSWLLARDISEGREELNFSTWEQYSTKKQAKNMHEIREAVAEGEMPPWYYTLVHAEARLSPQERQLVQTWARESSPVQE